MSIYILCPHCGENLGEIFQFYLKVKENFNKENTNNTHIEKINLTSNNNDCLKEIFDELLITNHCCRIHLLGYVDPDRLHLY